MAFHLSEKKQLVQQATHVVNDHMKIIAKDLEIDKACSSYFARHSFASVLKHSGASTETISELLTHGNITTTKNYLASIEDDKIKRTTKALSAFKTKLKAV
jgi:site-specific recombinase XerD